MAVPGRAVPENAPAELVESELFAVDAYLQEFDATVVEADDEQHRVALRRTAFFPGGGGQPHDLGTLDWGGGPARVTKVKREGGRIWHWLDVPELPATGAEVQGVLDWDRRHLTMRTHTALHILCGVIWADHKIPVTGGNMDPGKGRLDFPFESMSAEFGRAIEKRINEEIAAARAILVEFVGRDKQADGGTHVLSTAEVGAVAVTGTESKGKGNKRVRIEVRDAVAE